MTHYDGEISYIVLDADGDTVQEGKYDNRKRWHRIEFAEKLQDWWAKGYQIRSRALTFDSAGKDW